jgi:hypothetical protein
MRKLSEKQFQDALAELTKAIAEGRVETRYDPLRRMR